MNRRAMTNLFRLVTLLFAPLFLASCSGSGAPPRDTEQPPLSGASIGGPFALLDKDGNTVRWSDFDGKFRIVYFGYTFCPDACPLDVAATMQGYMRLEKSDPQLAAQIQPIFISIDPERDTPERVGEFAAAFHPKLIGLTGTSQEVANAAKAFAAVYQKGEETAGGYLMDHSRVVYLMGRKGEPLAILPADEGPDAVAAEIRKWAH